MHGMDQKPYWSRLKMSPHFHTQMPGVSDASGQVRATGLFSVKPLKAATARKRAAELETEAKEKKARADASSSFGVVELAMDDSQISGDDSETTKFCDDADDVPWGTGPLTARWLEDEGF